MRNEPDLTQLEKHIQDIYGEIRYLAYTIEAVANSLKKLIPEEDTYGREEQSSDLLSSHP